MNKEHSDKRNTTRFEGVTQHLSRHRKFKGKPDVCYQINYRCPLSRKRIFKTIGWRSQGITAEYANVVRMNSLAEMQKQKFAGVVPTKAQKNITFAEAWELYKTKWLDAKDSKSILNDTVRVRKHLQDMMPQPLSRIGAKDIESLMLKLQKKGLSAQTIKHVLALMRRIMRKMIVWDMWQGTSPFEKVTMPKVNNQRQRYLTPYEAKALLQSLEHISVRMWLMSLISLHCGLRFGEIAALRKADIDFENQTIFIRDPKSGHDRHAIMTDQVKLALQKFVHKPPSALLFPTQKGEILKSKDDIFDRVIQAWEFNLGIRDRRQMVVFHTLRHTYASWLAKSGSGQAAIAEMLGHSSLEMSRRYTHLMPDSKKDAAKAINSLFIDAQRAEDII